jgi:hypothetical protein
VQVPQTGFDIDAVDVELYCVNTTEETFLIHSESESFTTIDEETGITAEHGSDPKKIKLAPGECIKVAEVKGWEWDGHVGMKISFVPGKTKPAIHKSYNFKESKGDFTIPSSGKLGRIIPPSR